MFLMVRMWTFEMSKCDVSRSISTELEPKVEKMTFSMRLRIESTGVFNPNQATWLI